jgi:lambda repressor-like predicted transcriptional regulator
MQPSTTFNPGKLREEIVNRGLTMAETAKQARIHINTLSNAMRTGRCEVETLKRLAYVLQTIKPIKGITIIRNAPRRKGATR